MAKHPFERILSLVDRKKILQSAIDHKSDLYLKNTKGKIRSALGLKVTLEGHLSLNFSNNPELFDPKISIVFFYVNKDRYFIKTQLQRNSQGWTLLNSSEFYKLNRRTHHRVELPDSVYMTLHIQSMRDLEVGQNVKILNFSAGGGRIFWPKSQKIGSGTPIKGILQWDKERLLPVEAQIVHSPRQNEYGIRFINLNVGSQNRLKTWAIELQQITLFS